jgi:hypothetical protein
MHQYIEETYVDASSRHKGNAALRLAGLVLAKELELVVLKLEVSNVTVTT